MRTLIVSELVTLDGVMEAPGGEPTHVHTGWAGELMTAEEERYKFDEVLEAGALLLGRVTYESFAGAWPTYEGEFADRMNAMPKYVVSSTLRDPSWTNATVLGPDLATEVTRLKQEDGGPLLVNGSCRLVHALLALGLVDELRLTVFPVTIGSGRRLFPETPDKTFLQLTDTRTFTSGIVTHHYRVGREEPQAAVSP